MQPVGVAAHAAVSQHQPLRDPGRSRPRRRGAARARGRRSRSRHLPACAQHNHTGKRLSDSPGRCSTTASHHPGPGGKRSALAGSEVRRRHARGTSAARPEGPSSKGGWRGRGRGSERGGTQGGGGQRAAGACAEGLVRATRPLSGQHRVRTVPVFFFFSRAWGVAAAWAPPRSLARAVGVWFRVFPLGGDPGRRDLSRAEALCGGSIFAWTVPCRRCAAVGLWPEEDPRIWAVALVYK